MITQGNDHMFVIRLATHAICRCNTACLLLHTLPYQHQLTIESKTYRLWTVYWTLTLSYGMSVL